MKAVGDYCRLANGKPLGFDYLRVLLALSVILWRSVVVCYGPEVESRAWLSPSRPFVYFIIPSFFALSGFLVAGSLLRNDLSSFVLLRAIRIYPALTVEVLLSAFLIGAIFTTFPLSAYFTDPEFFRYLLNVTGWIHYLLPGVFQDHPVDRVNIQLWTVPLELDCYILLVIFAMLRLHRSATAFVAASIALAAGSLLYIWYTQNLPRLAGPPPRKRVILCFVFGVAFDLYTDRLRMSLSLFLAPCVAFAAFVLNEYGLYLAPPIVADMTVHLGVQNVKLPAIEKFADNSQED